MLGVIYKPICAECRYAECHHAECRYAECHYAECRYAECHGACQRQCSLFFCGQWTLAAMSLIVRGDS
jgi:hypothetical protein